MCASVAVQTIFGNHIRQLREQAGLTMEQLCEKSGFSIRRLRAVERGEINLNLGTMLVLAMAMDTTLEDFLSGIVPELHRGKLPAARVIPITRYRKGQQNNCRNMKPGRANRFRQ